MICPRGSSITSIRMSLDLASKRNGFGARNEMGQGGHFVSNGFFGPSGPYFIGCIVKTKRNGCFCRRHWETLAPRPPVYVFNRKGPVQPVRGTFSTLRFHMGASSHVSCEYARFVAPHSAHVTHSDVSRKSVSQHRKGLTFRAYASRSGLLRQAPTDQLINPGRDA